MGLWHLVEGRRPFYSHSHHNDHKWSNGSYKIDTGRWHHIAYVYDDGMSRMYVNGRDVGVHKEYRINENGSGHGFLGFGARGEGLVHKFKGYMKDVVIFEKALAPELIGRIAINGFCTCLGTYKIFPYLTPVRNDKNALIKMTA